MGVFDVYTHFVLSIIGCTLPHSIPSRPNQSPINVEHFRAQHPPLAESTLSLHKRQHPSTGHIYHIVRVRDRVRVRVGWYLVTQIKQSGCTN